MAKFLFTLLRLAIAAAMLWYLSQAGSIDWQSFIGLAKQWPYTLAAIGLFIISTLIQSERLRILINTHQLDLTYFAAVKLTFIGVFFSTYLPGATGGDLVKIYYASKGNPGVRAEVITIMVLDRFIGLFSLLTLPLLLAPFFIELITAHQVLQAILAVSAAISSGIIIFTIIGAKFELADNRLLNWIENKFSFGSLLVRMLHTIHYYRNNIGVIFKALFYSYTLQLLMVGVALAIAQATNALGADLKMLFLIPMGYFANSVPITPGGLGVGEAAMESLFLMGGLTGGAETILGWRLTMIVVGLLGLVFYLKGEKRFVFNQSQPDMPQA